MIPPQQAQKVNRTLGRRARNVSQVQDMAAAHAGGTNLIK